MRGEYGRDYRVKAEWTLVTAPMQEPLTLDEAKSHCSITQDDDNANVNAYLMAARGAAEQYLNRALFTQTWKLQLSDFADVIWLPMAAPLASVTSVQYYATDGTLTTLSSSAYTVDTTSEPGRIVRAPNTAWPAVQAARLVTVIVTYVCGWSSVEDIPELMKQGIRLAIAAADADRTGGAVESAAAMKAAEACWNMAGRIYWREPELCL